jgi:hypothetical protein
MVEELLPSFIIRYAVFCLLLFYTIGILTDMFVTTSEYSARVRVMTLDLYEQLNRHKHRILSHWCSNLNFPATRHGDAWERGDIAPAHS